jgi:hypothetical protein
MQLYLNIDLNHKSVDDAFRLLVQNFGRTGFSLRTLLKSVIFQSKLALLPTGKILKRSLHLILASNLTTFFTNS